ncbi:MAG: helix-turn-helix domain-containing protein [bacterium]|nr:helix-turn-helix domain-containing protein [bacterium]
MRERFRRHGFTGTSRIVRNINRRLGNDDVGFDMTTLLAGINILGDDEGFAAVASRAFAPVFEKLFTHSTYAEGETAFEALQTERLLPSEKDAKARMLAIEMVTKALEGIEEFSIENKRDAAYLRGRLLDIEIADVMTSLLATGGVTAVEAIMHESIEVQLDQYWSALSFALDPRVTALGGWSEQPEHADADTPSTHTAPTTHERVSAIPASDTSPLISLEDVRSVLNVSRTTVYRLIRDNALEQIKVRGRSMVTRVSVDAYISSATEGAA